MINVLHTWGTILAAAGGVFVCPPRCASFQIRWGLEDMPADSGIRSDAGTLHAARGTGPELGRRFLERAM